jgi:hypothetical protein
MDYSVTAQKMDLSIKVAVRTSNPKYDVHLYLQNVLSKRRDILTTICMSLKGFEEMWKGKLYPSLYFIALLFLTWER